MLVWRNRLARRTYIQYVMRRLRVQVPFRACCVFFIVDTNENKQKISVDEKQHYK